MYLEFDWDPAKAETNLRKHGIGFETATLVFYDPHAVYEQDREEEQEARWQVIGLANEETLLLVAHLTEDQNGVEVVRIISARPVNREEKLKYARANG